MLEILSLAFMQRALMIGLIVAVIAPAIGLFLVLRRMSMYGDTLAHISLAGVAAGMLSGIYPVVTGILFAVVGSLGMDWLRKAYRGFHELSVAVVLSASLALAVILLSLGPGSAGEVLSYLFGSILAVSKTDLYLVAGLGLLVLITLFGLYKELLSTTFDEEFARIGGLPVKLVSNLLMVLTALTIGLTIRVVGVLLVSALMVVPVATALQLAHSFRGALLWSIAVGLVSVLTGLILAYFLDLAPGGTVVLTAVGLLILVLGYKRIRGLE